MAQEPTLPTPRPDEVNAIWARIAPWWHETTGPEGNEFHRTLIEPANDRLLSPRPGQHVLDLGCGGGNYARHLAGLGVRVTAVDACEPFLEIARREGPASIDYRRVDLTDAAQLLTLPGDADAAVCTMAMMDIPDIDPVLVTLRQILKPPRPFVFSISHPCFNGGTVRMTAELINETGRLEQNFGVQINGYLEERPSLSAGILNQPEPHWMFHRPLGRILGQAFAAGWVLDGLEEPAYARSQSNKHPFSWAKRPDIPPALVVRLR